MTKRQNSDGTKPKAKKWQQAISRSPSSLLQLDQNQCFLPNNIRASLFQVAILLPLTGPGIAGFTMRAKKDDPGTSPMECSRLQSQSSSRSRDNLKDDFDVKDLLAKFWRMEHGSWKWWSIFQPIGFFGAENVYRFQLVSCNFIVKSNFTLTKWLQSCWPSLPYHTRFFAANGWAACLKLRTTLCAIATPGYRRHEVFSSPTTG